MSPCSPNDVSINLPDGPSGPAIPGFGNPFALKIPNLNPFPDGFPEDLLSLLDKLQFIIPPGVIKPALNPNYGKDVFDAIMKLLDQFFPFLMLYKFFLPILSLIICIIEVLCALMNPFKLIGALRRLFRTCIPAFLNIFPIFALIIMIISILLLILALVEYIIQQVLKFVKTILRNISLLNKAFQEGNANAVQAAAKKLGSLLCIFQNLFVLLSLFNIIIQVIRDILSLGFSIPPCDDGDPSDSSRCCTPDVCPAIIKNDKYTRTTGTLQYFNDVSFATTLPSFGGNFFNIAVRPESWQIYDTEQTLEQYFINIVDAFDVPPTIIPKPVFFPMDSLYSALTPPKQAAYTVDMKLFYNPASWGRTGKPRFIKFNDCIVTAAPSRNLKIFDNSSTFIGQGVMNLAGGLGYENDGSALRGYAADGITPIGDQATLENFLHRAAVASSSPTFTPFDGYHFDKIEYTFKPNMETLIKKQLITLGCEPSLAFDRAFLNNVVSNGIAVKTNLLGRLVNNIGGVDPTIPAFPDPTAAQLCLSTALSALRSNLTADGVAQFQTVAQICLDKLKKDTSSAISAAIGIGFEACKSDFNLVPNIQFTSKPIKITVNLKEKTGIPLTTGVPADIAAGLAAQIKAYPTFGTTTNFEYDGYQSFTSYLTSADPGKGQMMISFDNNIFCTDTIPTDINVASTHTLQSLDYQFIYTPVGPVAPTGAGDTDGKPRRNESDQVNDSDKGGS
jgi:hypothetical protein